MKARLAASVGAVDQPSPAKRSAACLTRRGNEADRQRSHVWMPCVHASGLLRALLCTSVCARVVNNGEWNTKVCVRACVRGVRTHACECV